MFRFIKRSPWIALGAAGAWFLDPDQGAQRRALVSTKARRWKDEQMASRSTTAPLSGTSPSTRLPGEYSDPTLAQRSA